MHRYGFTPSPDRFLSSFCGSSRLTYLSLMKIYARSIASLAVIACLAITIVGCGSDVSPNALQISSNAINFGDVGIGQTAQSSVSITNVAPVPVEISQLSLSGQQFSIVSPEKLPISIPAGGTSEVSIAFAPTSSVDYSGQITVMNATATPLSARCSNAGAGNFAKGRLLSVKRDGS